MADEKQCEMRNNMMLFGLLIWRISDEEKGELFQRLEDANREITELKKARNEDAKANEKVVSIIASQKQNWLNERYKLRLQIEALMKELRIMEKTRKKSLSELQERLKEKEGLVQSKDKAAEEEKCKREELEERLAKAEKEVGELTKTLEKDVQEHSSELWRQKKAFLEIASSQRQLEAELGRANKQIEAKTHELENSLLLPQKLSLEIVKMQKELEQKDRLLAVMMKKSKVDTIENQSLFKEVKVPETKTKQAEEQTKKWRPTSKSRKQGRRSLRSMFAVEATSKAKTSSVGSITHDEQLEFSKDPDVVPEINDLSELEIARKHENLIFGEEEFCIRVVGKRQDMELKVFTEEMRLKDEKVEALCRHLINSESESKQLRSCIEGLSHEMSQLRDDNTKLQAVVSRRGEESVALRKQFTTQLKSFMSHKNTSRSRRENTKAEVQEEKERDYNSMETPQKNASKRGKETYSPDELGPLTSKAQSNAKEGSEKERLTPTNDYTEREMASGEKSVSLERSSSTSQPISLTKNPPWRMDLHALGVSYKIKRLKQHLMMLERYIGKQESQEIDKNNDTEKRDLLLLITLLNKQVTRYQSLQEKIDDLCRKMHVNDPEKIHGKLKANGESKTSLEQFLEETFQLQRYIVATGQKLMEIQTKIGSGFVGILGSFTTESSSSSSNCFDPERFTESIKSLFQEVQRGLEVRISKIIGDLEGTLAREGMIQLKRRDHNKQRVQDTIKRVNSLHLLSSS